MDPGAAEPRSSAARLETNTDLAQYLESSIDMVARVRAAKEAAQRKMETFGHVSEYEIRKIYGQKKEPETKEKDEPHLKTGTADEAEAKED